jgi:predicted small lipoprotein YifL
MSKFRLFAAILALATLAACGDLGPTAPQDHTADDGFQGWLGSGGGG